MNTSSYRAAAALAILCSLSLGLSGVSAPAQQPAPSPPQITPETKQRYAAASAAVAQDPEYLRAVKEVAKAQRAADQIFFEKLRRLEPSLKDYLNYLEKVRSSETAPAGQ